MEKLTIIAIYYCIINAVGALINIADKRLAIKGKRRISEKLLWVIGIYGGAAGSSRAAMKAVRHKTKHKKFMVGMPFLIILHAAVIAIIIYQICIK